MTKSDAELLSELIAAFSTVITQTTRAICRNSRGQVSRHLIAIDIQKEADKLPDQMKIARCILGNIASQLDDKAFEPLVIPPSQ